MTVSSEIIEVLEYFCGKFGIAIDWTQENILPYVQSLGEKLIQYEISTSIFWIIFSAVITILLIIGSVVSFFPAREANYSENKASTIFFIAFLVCASFSLIGTFIVTAEQVIDILTAIHLPEKAILDAIESIASTSA